MIYQLIVIGDDGETTVISKAKINEIGGNLGTVMIETLIDTYQEREFAIAQQKLALSTRKRDPNAMYMGYVNDSHITEGPFGSDHEARKFMLSKYREGTFKVRRVKE